MALAIELRCLRELKFALLETLLHTNDTARQGANSLLLEWLSRCMGDTRVCLKSYVCVG